MWQHQKKDAKPMTRWNLCFYPNDMYAKRAGAEILQLQLPGEIANGNLPIKPDFAGAPLRIGASGGKSFFFKQRDSSLNASQPLVEPHTWPPGDPRMRLDGSCRIVSDRRFVESGSTIEHGTNPGSSQSATCVRMDRRRRLAAFV